MSEMLIKKTDYSLQGLLPDISLLATGEQAKQAASTSTVPA